VLSDHGSLALYAEALGKPVILAGRESAVTVPGSAAAQLAAEARIWDPDADPRAQLEAARREAARREAARREAARLGSAQRESPRPEPARLESTRPSPKRDPIADCAPKLRALIYELLKLDEPPAPAAFDPVMAPPAHDVPVPAWVVGVDPGPDGVHVERYPDLATGDPHPALPYRHVVADIRTASLTQLESAAVILTDAPVESAAVQVTPFPGGCVVHAGGSRYVLRFLPDALRVAPDALRVVPDDPATAPPTGNYPAPDVDPAILGSLAYVRLRTSGTIPELDTLLVGGRTVTVARD
jgi:hypothetical protein